uniref:Major facilitator superfamily (MFS) profile domain-containing protein n=1 Tax=Biomphalaria glabrata TaxID=6526 RepID=A0A2C9JP49_BIOGL
MGDLFKGTSLDDEDHSFCQTATVPTEGMKNSERDCRAPDGGYGWFVVLGCFVMHIIMGGLDRSEGVFFLLLLDTFGESAQLTSWPGAVVCTLQLTLGPLANAFSARYSVRASVMVGGVLASLGLILNSFATNIYFLFFTHAIIGGVGRGLAYTPGLSLVGIYFDKRVGLATGLGTSGVGLGTFVIVPLVQFFTVYYGYTGTYLIIGGLAAHLLVAAMLFRPLSFHYKFTRRHEHTTQNSTKNIPAEDLEQENFIHEKHDPETNSGFISNDKELIPHPDPYSVIKTQQKQERRICTRMSHSIVSSMQICFPRDNYRESKENSRKLFHLYLLKKPPFTLFCISIWLFAMAFRAAFTFMPALVKSKGISESEAAMALSVAGAVDSLGRILSGLILDTTLLRPYRPVLYTLIIFGVAAVAFVLPTLNSIASFCVFCALYGFFTGAFISQKSVILVDILEPKHVSNSLGLLIGFQGFGNLLGPPLAGYLKDNFGTFDEAFYLGGGLLAVSGVLMLISNCFLRFDKTKKRKCLSISARH